MLLQILTEFTLVPSNPCKSPIFLAFSLGLGVLAWRLWNFTIIPFLRPKEPLELPYWMPGLGHTIAFFMNSNAIIKRGLKLSKNKKPYAITIVGGTKFYILTSPDDVSAAYRNTDTLSWDHFQEDLMNAFGLKKSSIKDIWRKREENENLHFEPPQVSPVGKSFVKFTEEVFTRQLVPGTKLDELTRNIGPYISKTLSWEKLPGPAMLNASTTHIQLSLKVFSQTKMTEMISEYMFGKIIYQIEPNIVEHSRYFADNVWKILFHYPECLSSRLSNSTGRLRQAFISYAKVPEDQRGDAMWFIRCIMISQERAGIAEDDRASLILLLYWASATNAINTLFWMLSYISFDSDLFHKIRTETAPVFENGVIDIKTLCTDCPLLESFFLEVLRMKNGAMGVRHVSKPTTINGTYFRPGNTIAIPLRLLHFDKQIWGSRSEEFCPERFIVDKNLKNNAAFRPFGGGVSLCPGRFLARQQIFGLIATFVQRFDIEKPDIYVNDTLNSQEFPSLDDTKPSTGTNGCIETDDVIINVRKSPMYDSLSDLS